MNIIEACELMDEFDFSGAVRAIVERQIIPDSGGDGRWEDLDAEALRGLFLMLQSNPLRDTYYTLCVLEKVGALDQIDREECIRGVLRFHKGRGLFIKDSPGSVNWHIRGNVQDAFCALESLRMLNALDSIGNLHKWQFRTTRYHMREGTPVQWETLADWGLAERLSRELKLSGVK